MAAMQLTRTHRILIGVVVAGAVVIAGIGFAGSYAAVRALALQKGFGSFSLVFPIGIDAGICVLLALDLLLTWIRIPFPLLRQTAWLLTAATIAFNGAAAWPDPLGVGMHAVIPILFVVTVEAARHAVGRIADITADRHMEGVRITRWLLSPVPTFKLWRRMKLWELRSYEQAVGMEQDRLIYQARLQARYGRAWRRKAPVEALMPLRLARIGVPLSQTAPEGLAAAGIDPMLLPPAAAAIATGSAVPASSAPALEAGAAALTGAGAAGQAGAGAGIAGLPGGAEGQAGFAGAAAGVAGRPGLPGGVPAQAGVPVGAAGQPGLAGAAAGFPGQAGPPGGAGGPAGQAAPQAPATAYAPGAEPHPGSGAEPRLREGAGRGTAPQGHTPLPFAVDPTAMPAAHDSAWFAAPLAPQAAYEGGYNPQYVEGLEPTPVMPPTGPDEDVPQQEQLPVPPAADDDDSASDSDSGFDQVKFNEAAYEVFRSYLDEHSDFPTPEQVDIHLSDRHGIDHPRSSSMIRKLMPGLKLRYQRELENEHIA
ncbi:DUF2637 domain-containing protein [Streptomyces sp. XY332]|uniref:DUF2637 domain-containing protein n=2 Tax=unclassified Streptomyces TaxID=2593676 RepID=UPI0006B1C15A|nr:DUF2637 domain-containing protein [Streptomyces sp. KS 21]KOY54718.1 hypothetical protein ADK59_28830 [Streptomyces sp. XY332]TDU76738.1 uncharacterized protein DUF2637 [Streptomyces sp. KS 21]